MTAARPKSRSTSEPTLSRENKSDFWIRSEIRVSTVRLLAVSSYASTVGSCRRSSSLLLLCSIRSCSPGFQTVSLKLTEDSTTNVVYYLNAEQGVAYPWNSRHNTCGFASMKVGGVFKIVPSIVISMGVKNLSDSAIDVRGDAVLYTSERRLGALDMSATSTSNPGSQAAQLDMTL